MGRQDETLLSYSRELRKSMTKEERHLWYDFLRTLPMGFRRQKVIGNYIVDFCCPGRKLIVELDGSQHYEQKGLEYDSSRDDFLQGRGYRVLRYSNADVNANFKGVCEDIMKNLGMEI